MESYNQIRIWGQVTAENGNIFPGIRVKLVKKFKKRRKNIYRVVQETRTDEQGIYSFWIEEYRKEQYKIVVVDYL